MPPDLDGVLALTALTQCLVHELSREIDAGTYQFDCHPFLVRQNKWRACRYGLEARLVNPRTFASTPVRQIIREMVDRLGPAASALGCSDHLASVLDLAERPTGADLQLAAHRESGDLAEVVRRMLVRSEL
jgi:carboxylate-amine ligase